MPNALCKRCPFMDACEISCPALMAIKDIYQEQDAASKAELIAEYAKKIGLIKFEIAPDLKELGEKVLNH